MCVTNASSSFILGLFWGGSGLAGGSCQLLPSSTALLCRVPAPETSRFAIPFGVHQAVAQKQWDARSFLNFSFWQSSKEHF